jgi:hypothetical protein
MGNNMSSDGLFSVCGKHSASVDLGNDLVCYNNCYAEFVCDSLEGAQKLCQMHLSGTQLTSATKVSSVQSSGGVNHHQGKSIFTHQGSSL